MSAGRHFNPLARPARLHLGQFLGQFLASCKRAAGHSLLAAVFLQPLRRLWLHLGHRTSSPDLLSEEAHLRKLGGMAPFGVTGDEGEEIERSLGGNERHKRTGERD